MSTNGLNDSPRQSVKFVTPGKASEVLGVHPQTLRRWAKAGTLPHYVTGGGRYRFNVESFLAAKGLRAA